MEEFYRRVKKYSLGMKMFSPGESVVAGVSGGADSLCLFLVLLRMSREIGFFLQVVHVHHGLRESAQEDLRFVERLCEKEKVPCRCVLADAAGKALEWRTGVEEAGRRLRYTAFEETRAFLEAERGRPCHIAVAHHREDQAETVLFHLCRGTDIRGARGMLPVSGYIVRPLLQETRSEIEAFLREQGMTWREDETNEDTSYTRNYLRREVLPRLKEGVNPSSAQNLARFAGTCAETERFLEKVTEEALGRCILEPRWTAAGESSRLTGKSPMSLSGEVPMIPASGEAQKTAGEASAVPDSGEAQKTAGEASAVPASGEAQKTAGEASAVPVPGEVLKVAGIKTEEDRSRRTMTGRGSDIVLSLEALKKEDPLIRGRILYHCLALCAGRRKDLSAVHVDAMRGLCDGENDGSLSLPGKVTLFRSGGLLFFYKKSALKNNEGFGPESNSGETVCQRQAGLQGNSGETVRQRQAGPEGNSGETELQKQAGSESNSGETVCQRQAGSENSSEGSVPAGPSGNESSFAGSLLARELRRCGAVIPLSEEEYVCRSFEFDGDLSAIPQNKYTKWFDYDKIGMFPVFRTRQAGDRMSLLAGGRDKELISRKIAKIMIDAKIPARIRSEAVLPFCGNEALWIPGLRMGDRFKVSPGTVRILEISWQKGSSENE